MDSSLAKALELGSVPKPLKAASLDGCLLWEVSHQTTPVTVLFGNNHVEEITFLEFSSPNQLVIRGYPWLRQHNPQVDWLTGEVKF